jgi:hypothetical protein
MHFLHFPSDILKKPVEALFARRQERGGGRLLRSQLMLPTVNLSRRCSRTDRSVVEEGSVSGKLPTKPVESLSQTRQERGGGRLSVELPGFPIPLHREMEIPRATGVPIAFSASRMFVTAGRLDACADYQEAARIYRTGYFKQICFPPANPGGLNPWTCARSGDFEQACSKQPFPSGL